MIEFTVTVRYDKHAGKGNPTAADYKKELEDVLNEHVVADEIEIWDNDGEPALCSVTVGINKTKDRDIVVNTYPPVAGAF